MATRAVSTVVEYMAWDTANNVGKTGDNANHTLKWVKDGTSSSTTNSPSEIDSTNCPGLYKVTLTATETDCVYGTLHGKSSTSGIVIMPISIGFTYANTSAPATAGVPDVNVKNINNVAATSVTTINANLGTTQPVNFTGTGASALAKSDMIDIASAAVSATTAQIGTNIVKVNNVTVTGTGASGDEWGP